MLQFLFSGISLIYKYCFICFCFSACVKHRDIKSHWTMGKVNKKPFRRDAEQTGKSKPVGKIDFQFFHSCCTKMLRDGSKSDNVNSNNNSFQISAHPIMWLCWRIFSVILTIAKILAISSIKIPLIVIPPIAYIQEIR